MKVVVSDESKSFQAAIDRDLGHAIQVLDKTFGTLAVPAPPTHPEQKGRRPYVTVS